MATDFQIKKILIAIEDSNYSEKATVYGFGLARTFNAAVALVHVNNIPPSTSFTTDPLIIEPQVMVPDLIHVQEESSKKLLDKYTERYGQGLTCYTFSKLGDTRDEILNTAEEWGADLIILGTHGRTGFDHFISGSVAESVSRHAKCPVLIVPVKEAG